MAALVGLVSEPAGNLARSCAPSVGESACWLHRLAPTAITYLRAGTPYTDTLPALAQAQVWAGGGTTTFDLTTQKWVSFILPQNGGAATLYITPEATLQGIATGQDIVPLEVLHRHTWRRWQWRNLVPPGPGNSISGGGSYGVLASQSMSGGGSYGSLDSQSMSGGGTLASFLWYQGTPSSATGTSLGEYFYFDDDIVADTILWDFDAGASGYFRVKVGSDLAITLEQSFVGGNTGQVLTVVAGGTLALRVWYWITTSNQYTGVLSDKWLKVLGPAGVLMGENHIANGLLSASFNGVLTRGVASSHPYAQFPNNAKSRHKMFYVVQNNGGSGSTIGYIAQPTSDLSGGTICMTDRQPVGAIASLLDVSGNGNDFTPGPLGAQELLAGPYA